MVANDVKVMNGITAEELVKDPYPSYKKFRDEASCVFVSAVNRYFVTRWEDCKFVEHNHEFFTTREKESLMNKTFGVSMLRSDGMDHRRLRGAVEGIIRPKGVKSIWGELIQKDVEDLIERNFHRGEMDLDKDFAGPLAARTLKHLLSLNNASDEEMVNWSLDFMDGMGNLIDDPDVWRRVSETNSQIDRLLDTEVERLKKEPEENVLSAMVAGGYTIEEIRSNVKLFISGGLNEPKDAITATTWALLTHPDQLELVKKDPSLFMNATEEALRMWSPVGMYPRTVTKDVMLGDTHLKEGTKIFVVVASANRDERNFQNADRYDITREKIKSHMAFSIGSHFCVGTYIARAQLMTALPQLFAKLPNLRLDEERPTEMIGLAFRGFRNLFVKWDV